VIQKAHSEKNKRLSLGIAAMNAKMQIKALNWMESISPSMPTKLQTQFRLLQRLIRQGFGFS
jgi:hypothetical protein